MENLVNLLFVFWTTACVSADKDTYDINDELISWRISNGDTAIEGQFPYQASIYYHDRFSCGASVIHKRWVLTAAHCKVTNNVKDAYVKVGTNYINETVGQKISIEKFIAHEDYEIDKIVHVRSTILVDVSNDIALIRLSNDIQFSESAKQIRLAKYDAHKYETVTATISGWGTTDNVSNQSEELQYAKVKVISDAACERTWARLKMLIFRRCICTSVIDRKGTCRGDSGGPLVYRNEQIGIVAVGHPDCKRSVPNVNTRVSSFIPWINQKMKSYSDTLP